MSLKEKLKATLDEYVKNQIIVPCDEPCEWVSNLVCVEKTSGKLRLCIDPQELNRNLLRDYYEIPTLDEVGFALSGKKYFCVLDIKDGFHHMVLDAESSKLCSFSTPFGTYQYLRAPFGLNCITEMFSKRVNQYFGNIPGVFIYVDDIICSANSIEELHLILEKIMSVARINNIKFNPSKLQYCVKEVKYVGSIFSEGMIKPDPDRIRSIVETKSPRTKKELMSYLGMLNFIRNHIPNLSDMISPLRALLKNDVIFEWKKCHEDVFLKIRSIIASNTILTQFDFQKPIVIQSDCSKDAIGGCLLQDNKPVVFASRCLTETETQYAQIEKEFLAITFLLCKFHNYIYGHQNVLVQTDHQPLICIKEKDLFKIKK